MAITPGGRVGDATPLGKGKRRVLDDYVREVAHALIRKGYDKSHAIAVAKNSLKRWRRGGGHVRPQVRAGAAAHLGVQEALDKRRGGGLNLATPAQPMASSQDGPRGTMQGMGTLTTKKRKSLPKSSFALPAARKYPIPDPAHAANALSRVAANGSPAQKQAVARAVAKRYPGMAKRSKSKVLAGKGRAFPGAAAPFGKTKSLSTPREALVAAIAAKAKELNLTVESEPGAFDFEEAVERRAALAQELAARRLAAQ